MTKYKRGADGLIQCGNMRCKKVNGSRREVWNGTACKTKGGLTKAGLHYNPKTGRYVSKKKSLQAKKEKGSRFAKKGYALAKKGVFGPLRLSGHSKKNKKGGTIKPSNLVLNQLSRLSALKGGIKRRTAKRRN